MDKNIGARGLGLSAFLVQKNSKFALTYGANLDFNELDSSAKISFSINVFNTPQLFEFLMKFDSLPGLMKLNK
jgi:hypothetical protein